MLARKAVLAQAGFLGLFLGVRKLLRASRHQVFQMMAMEVQLGVALFDLAEHGVKAVDKDAEFVIGNFGGADVIVFDRG